MIVRIKQKIVKCQSIAWAFSVLIKNEDISIERIVAKELTDTYFVKNKVLLNKFYIYIII